MTLLFAAGGWHEADWRARLQKALPGRPVHTMSDSFDRQAIAYVASWKHPPGFLAGLPHLKAIFSLGAGIDHLFADPQLPDVPIVRVVDPDLTTRMSEYVVLHALAHLRQLPRYMTQQAKGAWEDDRLQPAARDVRVGLLGLGELGLDAARKLAVMGFDVAGWSRTAKTVEGLATFSGDEGLRTFLSRTDILVALLPLTDATRGILNRDLFAALARDGRLGGPILINAGRGGLQVEADVVACLRDGTLKAASLDVFEVEPLPASSALWTLPNVLITPHNAAMSSPDAIAAHIARGIAAIEAGKAPVGLVDRSAGY